jgi:hypothetical protein
MASNKQVRLSNVVLCFPNIAEPQAFAGQDPAYGAKFPIVPGSDNQKAIEAAMLDVAKQEWKDRGVKNYEDLIAKDNTAFHTYVYEDKDGAPWMGFENKHYLSVRNSKTQPTVFNKYNEKITDKAQIESLAHSGAIVHASIEIWAQDDPKYGKRLNCSLRGIMVTGEGENFSGGGSTASDNDFADVAIAPADAEDLL